MWRPKQQTKIATHTRLPIEIQQNFPPQLFRSPVNHRKVRYWHKLQVLGTCDSYKPPAAVFQPLKTASPLISVTFMCTSWRIPELIRLPGWKLIEVRTFIRISDLNGWIMPQFGRWRWSSSLLKQRSVLTIIIIINIIIVYMHTGHNQKKSPTKCISLNTSLKVERDFQIIAFWVYLQLTQHPKLTSYV